MEFYIERLTAFSDDLIEKLNKLLNQLNNKAIPLAEEDIKSILSSPDSFLFVTKRSDDNEIVGMVTLVVYRIPFGKKAWIEDIVVDNEFRHKGIATKLLQQAIETAKTEGVKSLNLTSNSAREAANRLYEHLGFEKRDTNVYRIKL